MPDKCQMAAKAGEGKSVAVAEWAQMIIFTPCSAPLCNTQTVMDGSMLYWASRWEDARHGVVMLNAVRECRRERVKSRVFHAYLYVDCSTLVAQRTDLVCSLHVGWQVGLLEREITCSETRARAVEMSSLEAPIPAGRSSRGTSSCSALAHGMH